MTVSNKKFLSTEELGRLLGVTRQTVRNWFIKGQIKAFKIGQNIKIPKEEAVSLLMACEQPIPAWLRSKEQGQAKEV